MTTPSTRKRPPSRSQGQDEVPDRPQRRASDRIAIDTTAVDTEPLKPTRIPLAMRLPLAGAVCILVAHGLVAIGINALNLQGHPHPVLIIALVAVFSLLLTVGLLYKIASGLSARLAEIVEVLGHSRIGDYSHRIDRGLGDDIGRVAHNVNLLLSSSAQREKRVLESALSDPLTGLPNRTLLTERLRHMLALSRRQPTPFAIGVIDLDRFKFVNDTLGHAAGDTVLVEVARRLRATVRDSDTVARLGGDEFVLLLTGGEATVREVASRIIDAMQMPMVHLEQRIDIGLSIGIALYPNHGADDRTLLRHADNAMYQAKRRRSGIEVFSGETNEVRRSYLSMLGELRKALESGQILLEYQPKLDVASGLIVGFEGLVRWKHPTRGMVQPSEFVPFSEQSGFLREITQFVVNEGARFSRSLSDRGLDLAISINVSAQDIEHQGFARIIEAILQEQRPEPGRLCLEITESGLVSETATAVANLKAVAALGVRLAVDDFGTGYATLKQLQNLPVHELKIDRSFVSGMNENRGGQTIVKSTIDLGKQLGLRVVAEGVETVGELRGLSAMGCDEIQGYYVAKPMPAEEVINYVRIRNSLQGIARKRIGALPTKV
jgi:diguanylate cyclase (GGDEF)-like protein